MYFLTDYNAPMGRIVQIDLFNSNLDSLTEIVGESTDVIEMSSNIQHIGNKLIIIYKRDVANIIRIFDTISRKFIKDIKLPCPGKINGLSKSSDGKEDIFFKFTSFLYPGTIYKYSLESNELIVLKESIVLGFNKNKYRVTKIFYESKDGTKIPMHIVINKYANPLKNTPMQLYAYGGVGVSMGPTFSPSVIVPLQTMNMNFAIAYIRGGCEYGDKWHDGGMRNLKQNCFDDFKYAAKYLINNKYTSRKKLLIKGGSNGGLLVAACVNQNPELFGFYTNSWCDGYDKIP
jgi:prolyl oligopeptidase